MIQVHMVEGRSPQLKAQLTAEITEVAQRVLGISADRVHVLVSEYDTEDWSVGGAPIRSQGALP